MWLAPRRFAAMLDNTLLAAKEGTKPFPHVGIIDQNHLLTFGIGQHVMIEDMELADGEATAGSVCVLNSDEAVEVSKIVRSMPDAGKKDTVISVAVADSILRVESGDDMLAEIKSVPDNQALMGMFSKTRTYYSAPVQPASSVTVFESSILAVLGRLKVDESRIVLTPNWVASTTMFSVGTVRGFIEQNITTPERLISPHTNGDERVGTVGAGGQLGMLLDV